MLQVPTTQLGKIKQQIYNDLQALVNKQVLATAKMVDLSRDPLQNDYFSFPIALLGMSSTAANFEDTRNNQRISNFPILIVQKTTGIELATDTEDLTHNILSEFDNDPTLAGNAAWVDAAVVGSESRSSADKEYVITAIVLKVHYLVNLTFTNP